MNCRMKYLLVFFILTGVAQAEIPAQNDQLKAGLELLQKKKFKLAEDHFIALNKQFPDQMTYLNNLAVAQMAQGKAEQALENLNTVIASDKYFSVTQKNITQIYSFMASQAYSKALDKKDAPVIPELAILSDVMPTNVAVPAPTEVVKEEVKENLDIILEQKTASWASAWMKGDINDYLSNYSENFKPFGKLSYNDWVAQRRYRFRLSKDIQVSYNQLKIYVDSAKMSAIVEFSQQYKAGEYQDKVKKQLYWVREGDRWLIAQEQVTEQN